MNHGSWCSSNFSIKRECGPVLGFRWNWDGNKFSNVNLIYIVSIMIPSHHDALIYRRLLLFNIKSYYIISSLLWHVWDETVCWIKFVNIWIFWYTHISTIQKFSTIMMWSYIVLNSVSVQNLMFLYSYFWFWLCRLRLSVLTLVNQKIQVGFVRN